MSFTIMRVIEIDAAHRVPEHGSGCRNLHGHRYKIEAYCIGEIATEGEQTGMTLDFKFLKEEMMKAIHDNCDHGTILRYDDPLLEMLAPGISLVGLGLATAQPGLKLYIMQDVPTAENLAKHWFSLLKHPVAVRSLGRASLQKIRVWETPNCFASFPT